MAVDVKESGRGAFFILLRRPHPLFGQLALPLRGDALLLAKMGDLLSPRFDLRQPVQPEDAPPFAGSLIAGRLKRAAAHQGQQRHVKEERFERIEPRRQGVKSAGMPQQPLGQKRRQGTKHPGLRHIVSGHKFKERPGQHPAGSQDPLKAAGRGVTHRRP